MRVLLVAIIASILLVTVSIAEEIKQTIEVEFNSINLYIDGYKVESDNILYNGTIYVPIRKTAEILGKEVEWDDKKRNASINEVTNDKLHITYAGPQANPESTYLRWGYITIVFNKDMKDIHDTDNIYLVSAYGDRIKIRKVQEGCTKKDNLLIIPSKQLKLDTYYNLYIPSGTLKAYDGEAYDQDINLHFKTAKNVVRGKIKSNNDYYRTKIYLENDYYSYEGYVTMQGEFFFVNMEKGTYSIRMFGKNNEVLIDKEVEVKERGISHVNISLDDNSKVVKFSDRNLEAIIRAAIDKPSGDIYKEEVEKINFLSNSGINITDLDGIQYLKNLNVLEIHSSVLRDIDLISNLTHLKELYLFDNKISDIDALEKLTSLEKICMGENDIYDIKPLENLKNLKYIELQGNKISDLSSLSKLTNLTGLVLSNNIINDITPLANLKSLTKLKLSSNRIIDYSPVSEYYNNLLDVDFEIEK